MVAVPEEVCEGPGVGEALEYRIHKAGVPHVPQTCSGHCGSVKGGILERNE
jgi:hypothetical protein